MKAIIFVNGFRKRFIEETGGLNGLESLFDFFIDTSIYMKPWEYKRGFDDVVDHEKKFSVKNEKELKNLLQNKNIEYVLFVGLEWSEKRYATLKSIERSGIEWGILFIRGDQKGLFNGKKYDPNRFKKASKIKLIKLILKNIKYKLWFINITPSHYISNEIKALNFPEVKRGTKKILVNHKDYYLSNSFKKPDLENYIVFLDQAYPFHFGIGHGLAGKVEYYDKDLSEKYYQDLNEYLLFLSSSISKKVVICLHPNCPDKFNKYYSDYFKLVKYETGRYAKYAELLITHNSTSISFGYMHGIKSVMLILNNALPNSLAKRIRTKAETENLTLHEWPNSEINLDDVKIPSNRLIKDFYVPNPSSIDLISELKSVLN